MAAPFLGFENVQWPEHLRRHQLLAACDGLRAAKVGDSEQTCKEHEPGNLVAVINHSSAGAVCFFTNQLFIVANNGVSGTDVAVAALVWTANSLVFTASGGTASAFRPMTRACSRMLRPFSKRILAGGLRPYVGSPFALDLSCVGAGEPRHKGEQALALSISRGVIKLHGQATDRAREALWHVIDPSDRSVLKACGDQRRFIDAGAAVLSREWMGAPLSFQFRM